MLETGYLVGLGSNIDPARHVPQALQTLVREFGRLALGPVFETMPSGMASDRPFWNAMLFLPSREGETELKARLVAIEEALGRDRSDPDRARKDRAMDLDILRPLSLPTPELLRAEHFEPYLQASLAGMADFLELPFDHRHQDRGARCLVFLGGRSVDEAAWLVWSAGKLRVLTESDVDGDDHGAA